MIRNWTIGLGSVGLSLAVGIIVRNSSGGSTQVSSKEIPRASVSRVVLFDESQFDVPPLHIEFASPIASAIEIASVKASCNCADAKIEKSPIQPYGSIRLTVQPRLHNGGNHVTWTVLGPNENPVIQVEGYLELLRRTKLWGDWSSLNFGIGPRGEAVTLDREVTRVVEQGEPAPDCEVTFEDPNVAVSVARADSKVLKADPSKTQHSWKIHFQSRYPDVDEPVSRRVHAMIRVGDKIQRREIVLSWRSR